MTHSPPGDGRPGPARSPRGVRRARRHAAEPRIPPTDGGPDTGDCAACAPTPTGPAAPTSRPRPSPYGRRGIGDGADTRPKIPRAPGRSVRSRDLSAGRSAPQHSAGAAVAGLHPFVQPPDVSLSQERQDPLPQPAGFPVGDDLDDRSARPMRGEEEPAQSEFDVPVVPENGVQVQAGHGVNHSVTARSGTGVCCPLRTPGGSSGATCTPPWCMAGMSQGTSACMCGARRATILSWPGGRCRAPVRARAARRARMTPRPLPDDCRRALNAGPSDLPVWPSALWGRLLTDPEDLFDDQRRPGHHMCPRVPMRSREATGPPHTDEPSRTAAVGTCPSSPPRLSSHTTGSGPPDCPHV